MISKLLTKVASGIMTVGMPGNTRRIDYAGTRDSKSAPAPAAPKPAPKPAPAKANKAQPVASPAKPTPKPAKATTAPLTLSLGPANVMPIPNGFSMPSEGVDLSLPTKALTVGAPIELPAPAAAPVAAPATAKPDAAASTARSKARERLVRNTNAKRRANVASEYTPAGRRAMYDKANYVHSHARAALVDPTRASVRDLPRDANTYMSSLFGMMSDPHYRAEHRARTQSAPAKPTPKPAKATTAPLTLTLPGQYDPIMPIPNGFSMPSEGIDLSLPTKALEPQPMLSVRDGKLINAPVAAPVVPPAPKPADKPVAAPAVATPRQLNINDITEEDMRKYRKYTGASDMNSEMDRWKTLQAMQGNMNASNRDYRMAKRRGEIK